MMSQKSQNLETQIPPSLQKTQELRTKLKTFKNILQEVGINLSFNEEPHILKQEQSLVLRDLENTLQTSNTCEEFVNGLKILCKKEKHFKKALLLTNLKKNDGNDTTCSRMRNERIEQESLMRIFLKVSNLQKYIFDILCDEITSNATEASEDTSWLHLLLNPLCYLPYIKDSEFMTSKLLDVLEIATYPAQLEILNSIPEIVPDGEHSDTAKQLCKLLDDKDDLTGAIIDCLNAMGLETEIRCDVQDRILFKIIDGGTSLKVFPVLITFLLSECRSQNLIQTLFKIRNAIDTLMPSSEKSEEKDSLKTLIFHKLQTITVSSKNISEAWLNMISLIKSACDHKPVDYLILFMLHHTVPFKKRIVEGIFRKRVQNGLLKIKQLEKMFEKYLLSQLLKDYFNSIVEIACSLIRSSGELCTREFAIAIFKLLFAHSYIKNIYRRDILDNLIILAGSNDKKIVNTVLKIMSMFLEYKDKLQQHTVSLMRLLEKLDSLELKQVKQVFDILCSLTCGQNADESMSGMRDEIHMIIRKQLYSTKRNIKHRGIISAVVMARHIVKVSEEDEVSVPNPIINISALPQGTVREAATLLELAYTCTTSCPELTGLYYDQLTSMLMTNNHFDKYFMSWLYETIQVGFEKIYTVGSVPHKIGDIKLSMQYMINRVSEMKVAVGINIGGLTLNNEPKIVLLASHFRLLRILHYRQNNGHLDGINALLGCSVVMPDIDIEDLDAGQAKKVSDCLFHCINWFREVLSAFVVQKDKNLRAKVVTRLKNLLELDKKLNECMLNIPNHKLPNSYFDILELNKQFVSPANIDKTKNPRKRLKSTTDNNQTTDVSTALSQRPNKKIIHKTNISAHPVVFREMDTDVVLLIKYPLIFHEDEISQTSSPKSTLNIDHLKFILADFVTKLDTLSHEKDVGLQHLHMVTPLHLIKDCVILLPLLQSHLKVLINKIKQLLECTDGRLDLQEMFTEEALDIKMCFGLILKTHQLVFSWTGFQHSCNLEILKDLLRSMRSENSQTLNSAHRLIIEFITKISELTEYCLEITQAVSLIQTIEMLHSLTTPNAEVQKKVVSVAEKLLSKRWFNTKGSLDSGRNFNLCIGVLVKAYLSSANTKTISGLVGTLQDQTDKLQTKEDYLHMLSSIDKQNFHVFYNGLCMALLQRVKTEVQSLTNNEHLLLWKTTTITMQGLMSVAKAQETKANLIIFLKKCIGILKVFLSDGIPILELMLRSKPDDVVDIFKTMQTTTRFLHHLCCYSKLTKDSSLMAFVPKFRLTLETLVYRVKAALAANNCSSAFWMGNLKNRDLQGEDILSQSTTITETNEENSEEELPEDDTDDEEPTAHNIISDNNGSTSSEVFD